LCTPKCTIAIVYSPLKRELPYLKDVAQKVSTKNYYNVITNAVFASGIGILADISKMDCRSSLQGQIGVLSSRRYKDTHVHKESLYSNSRKNTYIFFFAGENVLGFFRPGGEVAASNNDLGGCCCLFCWEEATTVRGRGREKP
jgi:hypothetical protein